MNCVESFFSIWWLRIGGGDTDAMIRSEEGCASEVSINGGLGLEL